MPFLIIMVFLLLIKISRFGSVNGLKRRNGFISFFMANAKQPATEDQSFYDI